MKQNKQPQRLTALLLIINLFVVGCIGMLDDYTAATFTIEGDRATMSGVIDGSTPQRVQALIDDHPQVTIIVMRQVDGSADDEANLIAARLVRQHGFHTRVPADGEIASGGVDFFLAGTQRTVDKGARLGIHSWAGEGTTGDKVPQDDPQHKLYLDYYAEMGVPADFYWFTLQAAPAESIHWMTWEEIQKYQMITEDLKSVVAQIEPKANESSTESNPEKSGQQPRLETGLDETDTELFQRLAETFALFRESSEKIWSNDYRLDRDRILLVRTDGQSDQYAYLINHPNPETLESAHQIPLPAELNLPPVYRLDALPRAAQLAENPTFDFAFPVGDTDVYMMKYTTAAVDEFMAPVSHDWSLFFAHEGLHRQQMKEWYENMGDQDIAGYPMTAENLALAMLENRVLVAGLQAEDRATRTVALQQFTAIRQLRIEQFPQVAELDNPQEVSEGTARYIEHSLGELLGYEGFNLQNFDQELTMMQSPETLESGVRDQFAFGRFYATGAALSRLLDLQGFDWKEAVIQGESHYGILLKQVDLNDHDALVESAKQIHSYDELLKLGRRGAEVAESEPSDIFGADDTTSQSSEDTQSDSYYAIGNPESDMVIVNAQGGPAPVLFTGEFEQVFSAVSLQDVYLVNVHQEQTLDPAYFSNNEITFEEAKAFDTESVQRLADVVNRFKHVGKKVYVVGISFGAFMVQDLLATQGNFADGYLLVVGRLDMPAEVWQPFSEGRFVGFAEGVKVIEFEGADEAGMGGDGVFTDANMAKLAAGLGHKRYSELLADVVLTNVLYVYGKLDEQVGRLSDTELAFLNSKAVKVFASAEGHGGGETDRLTNEALAQLLGTDLVNTDNVGQSSQRTVSTQAASGTLPATPDELEMLMMQHLKLTSPDALYDHLDSISDSDVIALVQDAVGLSSQAEVEVLLEQLYGEEDDRDTDSEEDGREDGKTEPSFGTTVSDTASVFNEKLTIQLEFMDSVQLEHGESKPWSDELKQPYVDAANQWLRALVGVEGKEAHTITIQVTVNTFSGGNGAAGPTEEESIGDFTLPVTGELIVGNHTYVAGFDQVEFYANILHEMGHIIGIGSFTEAFVIDDAATNGPIFRGPNSNKGMEMYNEIYGTTVNFVPISDDRGHLYDYVLQEDAPRTFADGSPLPPLTKEFMANGHIFGKVTLGVLDDIGYIVDYSAAESYVP